MPRPHPEDLIQLLGLEPLEPEGILLIQSWSSAERRADGKPLGTAAYALITSAPDSFSTMHRLATDEAWHFYLGDPLQMLLLHPDGGVERPVLGPDLLAGQRVQVVVPAGTWMGARLIAGGEYVLFGNTLAPGFTEDDYEGADLALADEYPQAAEEIRSLLRPGAPTVMEPPVG